MSPMTYLHKPTTLDIFLLIIIAVLSAAYLFQATSSNVQAATPAPVTHNHGASF